MLEHDRRRCNWRLFFRLGVRFATPAAHRRLALLMAYFWLNVLVGCSDQPKGVYVVSDKLRGVVAETRITNETAQSIRKVFSRGDISAIELRDVYGGVMSGVAIAAPAFKEKDIFVRGDCMSACAILAVQGRRLELTNGLFDREARLFFHGMYSATPNGRMHLTDLNGMMAPLIHARFPFVPLDDIVRMTNYSDIDSGLLIKREKFGGNYTFSDCNPLPHCRVLRSLPLKFL